MKIAIVTQEYSLAGGGLAYSCLQFIHVLDSLKNEIVIVDSNNITYPIITGGYNKNLGQSIANEIKLKQDSANIADCDLIIAFGGGFNGYYSTLLAENVCRRHLLLLRGSDANLCKWDNQQAFYLKYAAQHSCMVVGLSKEIIRNVHYLSPGANCCVIPNIIAPKTDVVKCPNTDKIVIGCGASHLNEKKGICFLINFLYKFHERNPNKELDLQLIGAIDDDVYETYKSMVVNLNLGDSIHFIQYQDRLQFQKAQMLWDFYIQASVCEGMGNSVCDCIAQGIPVFISDTGFIAEQIRCQFPEIVFNPTDVDSAVAQFETILSMDNLSDRYRNIYQHIFELTKGTKIIEKWKSIVEDSNNQPSVVPSLNSVLSVSLHDVCGEEHDHITTPVSVFRKFVMDVKKAGYGLCSMSRYIQMEKQDRCKWIVCTFDDGYEGLLHNAAPILNEFGFDATVFVCTDYIGQNNDWNYKDCHTRKHLSLAHLKELQSFGWEIGSHGVSHKSLLRLDDSEVDLQLSESKHILEAEFGPIKSYAYPYGDYSPYIESIVAKYYKYAFLLTQGGVFLDVDALRIHRYYISEINQIINVIS